MDISVVSQLETESVKELSKRHFNIPFVQRGYRWKSTQVLELVEDMLSFRASPDVPFYFLQALSITEDNKVIDGQQRLTTLSILLEELGQKTDGQIQLSYARASNKEYGALDTYFRCNAQKCIRKRIGNLSIDEKKCLLQNIYGARFLLHIIPTKEEDKTFRRLNDGKIMVSDSELVKCMLLTPQCDEPIEQTMARAGEWDAMERTFQNDDFFAFITPRNSWKEDDRMSILLRCAGIKPNEKEKHENNHPILAAFKRELKKNSREILWQNICSTFSDLQACYESPLWYGALGWAMHSGVVKWEIGFKQMTLKKIREIYSRFATIKNDEDLYHNDPESAKLFLFLFNVALCWKQAVRKYPFNQHRKVQTWSLEHIFARNQRIFETEDEFNDFCRSQAQSASFADYKKAEDKDAYLSSHILKQQYPDKEVNGLRNLALLGTSENTALLNWLFLEKEKKISDMIHSQRGFVPPATEQVFHKAYPGMDRRLPYLSEQDMLSYVNCMEETVKTFVAELGKIEEAN